MAAVGELRLVPFLEQYVACSANSSFHELPRASVRSVLQLWGPGHLRRLWACYSIPYEHVPLQCQMGPIARCTCRSCSRRNAFAIV